MKELTVIVAACMALGAGSLEAEAQAPKEKPAAVKNYESEFMYSEKKHTTRMSDFYFAFLYSEKQKNNKAAEELYNQYSALMLREGFFFSSNKEWEKNGKISEGFEVRHTKLWDQVFEFYKTQTMGYTVGQVMAAADKAAKEISKGHALLRK